MTTTETPTKYATVRTLTESGKEHTAFMYEQVDDAAHEIYGRASALQRRMETVKASLACGSIVNSLGELQLDGIRFDQWCAIYGERRRQFVATARHENVDETLVEELLVGIAARFQPTKKEG